MCRSRYGFFCSMKIFAIGAAFLCSAVLAAEVASGASPPAKEMSGRVMQGSAMQVEMTRIEHETRQLQAQMQKIRNASDKAERYRLLLAHLKSTRKTLNDMSSMDLKMTDDVNRGRIVSDPTLKRRQAIMSNIMEMMQSMVEQMALFQEPSLQ